MPGHVDAQTLKGWLSDGGELAFLDVSEAGQFAEGHPFFAVPLAYSRLELDLERLVPRRGVRLVLTDGGDGVGERARRRAEALGFTDVHVLSGGNPSWLAAGYTLFDGVNLPSKTFGELIEHERHTPRITAAELEEMRRRGDNIVIVDGRPWSEYTRFNIPGGICCPNGELALRIGELAPDPLTTIVVNCAGRTRSIIGAQTLIDFGIRNKVVALENGTQGWFLAGLEVERGASRRYPDERGLAAGDLEARQGRARAHAGRHGVEFVAAGEVLAWLRDPARTTYLLDVRTPEEFSEGSVPGFVHAPGGQLQQATDQWVGVRSARLVLLDGELVRAPMVAAWLKQLGHEASVLLEGLSARGEFEAAGIAAHRAASAGSGLPRLRKVTPQGLSALIWSGGGRAIDLRASGDYRRGHVPGSVWSIRPRIGDAIVDRSLPAVLIESEQGLARLAAIDLLEAGLEDVGLLEGGIAAWTGDGQRLNATPDAPADSERIDFAFHTFQRHEGNAEAARAYLAWETGLLAKLDAQERGVFRV